ncbi:MAG: hypothetical protein RBS88_12405 [Spongiibacteraceae bacterium]|jgi:hypothetical protein|nr:hypothetical protein [Spongiibacteraceae bacterium]
MQLFNAPGRLIESFLAGRWPQPVYQFSTWALVVVSGLAAGGIVRQAAGLAL